MTINSFSDCTVRYETTLNDCECPDHQIRNRVCKHMETLRRLYAKVRREEFEKMRKQFDCRLNGQAATQRCYFEMSFE